MRKVFIALTMLCLAFSANAQTDTSKDDNIPVITFDAIGAKFNAVDEDAEIETANGSCSFQELISGQAPEGMLDNLTEFNLRLSNDVSVHTELFSNGNPFDACSRVTLWQTQMVGDMYANQPEGQRKLDYGFNLNIDSIGVFTHSYMRISGLVPNNGNPQYVSLNLCYLRYCNVYVLIVVSGYESQSQFINEYVNSGTFSRCAPQFSGESLTPEQMAQYSDGIHYASLFFNNLFGFSYSPDLVEHRNEVRAIPYAFYKEYFGVDAPSKTADITACPKEMTSYIKEEVKKCKDYMKSMGITKLTR